MGGGNCINRFHYKFRFEKMGFNVWLEMALFNSWPIVCKWICGLCSWIRLFQRSDEQRRSSWQGVTGGSKRIEFSNWISEFWSLYSVYCHIDIDSSFPKQSISNHLKLCLDQYWLFNGFKCLHLVNISNKVCFCYSYVDLSFPRKQYLFVLNVKNEYHVVYWFYHNSVEYISWELSGIGSFYYNNIDIDLLWIIFQIEYFFVYLFSICCLLKIWGWI